MEIYYSSSAISRWHEEAKETTGGVALGETHQNQNLSEGATL
jgi:hypothetical protein